MSDINYKFMSNSTEWDTPIDFFKTLDQEFHFTLDPSADDINHKCAQYFTKEQDGLSQDWSGNIVFCNPPYGRKLYQWIRKAYEEGSKPNTVVVLLIPAKTDTTYFHDYIYHRSEIRFIKGRLKFGDGTNSAPFPSMLVIYRGPKM